MHILIFSTCSIAPGCAPEGRQGFTSHSLLKQGYANRKELFRTVDYSICFSYLLPFAFLPVVGLPSPDTTAGNQGFLPVVLLHKHPQPLALSELNLSIC
jgi:hypothetical protein